MHAPRPLADPATRQPGSLPEARTARNAGLLLLLCGLALAGPAAAQRAAPDPDAIVLRIGPIEQTLADLSRDFHSSVRIDSLKLTPDEDGIKRFMTYQENTLLLHAYALRDTTVLGEGDRYALGLNSEQILQTALRDQLTPLYLKADDTVLRAVYDRMATELHLAIIRVPTFVEMDSVRAELGRGRPFDEVARRLSRDPETGPNGGDMGWLEATRLPVEHQVALWSLPVGSISPTLAEPTFHVIYHVLGRRPGRPLKDFDTERPGILRAVATIELPKAAQAMHDDLMSAYHYRVDMDAAEWMRAFLAKETIGARRTYDPNLDKNYADLSAPREGPFWKEAPLKGAEANRPVAFIDGDTLTALAVIDELVFKPTLIWPVFDHVEDVTSLCDEAMYERVQEREAYRLGVPKRPEVVRKMMASRHWIHWRAYRRARILPEIQPTDGEVQDLYQKEIARFELPETRRFVVVNMPTEDLARRAAARLRAGLAPSSIVREMHAPDIRIAVTPDTGDGWAERGQHPTVDAALFSLAQGQVSDLIPDNGGYTVLRVDSIRPPRTMALEEVRKQLEDEIMAPREKRVTAAILKKARAEIPVWIDRAAIYRMDIDKRVFGPHPPEEGF